MIKALIFALGILLNVGAWATDYTMASGSRPTCTGGSWNVSGSVYTCSGSLALASADRILPGGNITVHANAGMTLAGSNTIGSNAVTVNLRTSWGDLVISGSGNVVYGSLTSNSGDINLSNTVVRGSISTNDSVTLSGGQVDGNVTGHNGVTTSGTVIGGNVTADSGSISLTGGSVGGRVYSDCCTVSTTNTDVGNGVASGSNTVTINGGTINGAISTSGGAGINISNATVASGSISATGVAIKISNSTIGSPLSQVNVSGNNWVTISGNTSVYGDTTAGSWSGALNVDNTSFIHGTCVSDSNSVTNPTQYPRCVGAAPLAEWRMDEFSWSGSVGEVKDSSGYGHHGRAAYANGSGPPPSTASATRAYTSGTQSTCHYGQFDASISPVYSYVDLPNFPTLPDAFTFTAWIRSSNVGASGQRILVHDDNQNGLGFSVGDGGSGSLRFFNRNIRRNGGLLSGSGSNSACGTGSGDPFCLDTNDVLDSNNWYFVAVAVDTIARRVTLYVFNQSGTLLAQPRSAYSGTWDIGSGTWAIGGETAASSEGTQTGFHFKGNIDEVGVYLGALSADDLRQVRTRVRTCPAPLAVNHYELRLPASSLACVPGTVTVAACATSAVPCSSYVTTLGGQTAVLATSGGATLGNTVVTFNAAGLATTTLSHPGAADGTQATVTLSNETAPAQTARVCCVGSACTTANSCATTFNTAGFIVSNAANGAATTVPGQIAGRSSDSYILRAVRTNTATKACEAALTGTTSVDIAYECDGNPSTCDGNRMSVAGSPAQTIPGNNNDNVTSFQAVNLSFDADGNAPFSFTYGDVGQVALHARKTIGGALLTGSTNVFAVKPYDFSVTELNCAGTVNPAAVDAGGGKFCAAGNDFSLRVTARAFGGATTPSFGRCDSSGGTGCAAAAEVVTLSHTLRAPLSGSGGVVGSSGSLGGTLSKSGFVFANGAGFATFNNLNWNEVGIINLRAASDNYLGNNLTACSATPAPGDACRGTYGDSGNVGRFYPQHFKIKLTPICGSFVYAGHTEAGPTPVLGQPFSVEVAAKYGSGDTQITTNYRSQLGFAKNVNLSLETSGLNAGGVSGDLYVGGNKGGSNAIPAAKFTSPGVGIVNHDDADLSKRISYVFNAAAPLTAPPAIPAASSTSPKVLTLHADDADTATSAATGNATVGARLGRLRLSNAFGSEKLPLNMPLQVQYWTGDVWVLNNLDNCTELKPEHFHLSSTLSSVSTTPNPIKITSGNGFVTLTAPGAGNTGSVDVAANLGTSGSDQSCLATHGGTAGLQPWLRSRNGGCAATYNRDPSARATFGIYTPESRRLIHVREFY